MISGPGSAHHRCPHNYNVAEISDNCPIFPEPQSLLPNEVWS